jgi:hypothetical protein
MNLLQNSRLRPTLALAGLLLPLCMACDSTEPPPDGGGTTGATSGGSFPQGTVSMPLTLAPLPVPAGKQKVYCTNLHLTNAQAIQVIGFESHQTQGGHHLLLFANKTDLPDSAPVECNQNLDPIKWTLLYASQVPKDTQVFPPQTGITIAAHQSVMLQTHYINVTPNDLSVTSEVDLEIGPTGSVTIPLAPLLFYNLGLQVPVGLSTATSTCPMPSDMNVVMVAGHMHRHGTDFTLDLSSGSGTPQRLYETLNWDSPEEKLFPTPLVVNQGSNLTWACSYNNTDNATINQPDEMCATLGNFYPATHGALLCFGVAGSCNCMFDN